MPRNKQEIKELVEYTVDLWIEISAEDHSKRPRSVQSRRTAYRKRARALVDWCLDQPVAT